ncbi:MAG: Alkaline phosphatase synthesis sensor protein PhoR [Alphaproteobacteria bacterium ADurb.Bin438]|nr:MAG: Alkaline phosphatase synthesis sensor protein PhoR [Alphaproteobacteria bacterium ADurb.Bin438]
MLKSKLTQKIILINFLALVILALGLFILSNHKTYIKNSEYKNLISYSLFIKNTLLTPKTVKKIPSKIINNNENIAFGYKSEKIDKKSENKIDFTINEFYAQKFLNNLLTPDISIKIYNSKVNLIASNKEKSSVTNPLNLKDLPLVLLGKVKEIKTETVDGNLIYISSLNYREKIIGIVIIEGGKNAINQALKDIRNAISIMFLLSLVINVILSIYLAKKITSPLYRLVNTANLISFKNSYNGEIPDFSKRKDEIGELSIALRKMVETLWQRLIASKNFASDISHEIKNPLSSLRSASETLLVLKDEEKRNNMAKIICKDIIRLDRLVNEISNLSKLDYELAKSEVFEIDICELLNNIIEIKKIGFENINFKTNLNFTKCPKIIANDVKIAQVFDNIISNAISFSKDFDTITINAFIKKNHLIISIEDEGIGIPNENLKKIFERFYSNRKKDDDNSHSGLGLAISKHIIESMGGKIFALNKNNKGAKFVIVLKNYK